MFIEVNGRRIGATYPAYIVAELSANHNQNFDRAVELVIAAKEAGADAVKLQTYTPDMLTLRAETEHFRIGGGTRWDGRTLADLYSEAYMPWEWQPKLKAVANDLHIDLFSTAFGPEAVEFLEELGVPVHKVASFELVDIHLIQKMASTGKPLILSTGMATLREIEEAVQAARNASSGAIQIALLKCTSAYPSLPEEMNLQTIPHMSQAFDVPVGLSDHSLGVAVPVAAVALGACIIEKHFTLSRKAGGPDSAHSLEPHEFKAMVDGVRVAEKAMGTVHYGISEQEAKSRIFRRSLFVAKDMNAGEVFTHDNLRSIRPGHGLAPKYLPIILGRTAAIAIKMGTPLEWDLVR